LFFQGKTKTKKPPSAAGAGDHSLPGSLNREDKTRALAEIEYRASPRHPWKPAGYLLATCKIPWLLAERYRCATAPDLHRISSLPPILCSFLARQKEKGENLSAHIQFLAAASIAEERGSVNTDTHPHPHRHSVLSMI
jgi:hypothetical protein